MMKAIYVSSSCVRNERIGQSVLELARQGYRNIELSGGTEPYSSLVEELTYLKEEWGLNYLLHNYFPPPDKHFVLNLASLDEEVFQASLDHCKKAIELSLAMGASRFGLHAGFFIDIKPAEVGKPLSRVRFFDRQKSIDRFREAFLYLKGFAGDQLKLYLENNVLSRANYQTYQGKNPLFLTDSAAYEELAASLDFNLLLDVAHLKVSARSLGLDFEKELAKLTPRSDYIHISDNDGLRDANQAFLTNSLLYEQLGRCDLSGKIYTLEVYEGADALRKSFDNLQKLLRNA